MNAIFFLVLNMLKLIDLAVYNVAMEIGDEIYEIVKRWDYFDWDTLGKQFVRNTDSMALNIAEGYGRFSYKENKLFCMYSRGSAFESTSCLRKAYTRKLISSEENSRIRFKFDRYFRLMSGYINSIGKSKQNQEKDTQNQIPEFENE